MKKVFLFGECMIELRKHSQNIMEQSFAGDTYNTAVYLKRCFNTIETGYITAIGQDELSEQMLTSFEDEHINTQLVYRDKKSVPGLYAIHTDETGERSFTYWRDSSAARDVIKHLDNKTLNEISTGDMFFFSGISLAVIRPEDREQFWQQLAHLKSSGVPIVFDPNYRPRMWTDVEEAKTAFAKAYQLADVMLPGIDDFESLYGIDTVEGIINLCTGFNIPELVIKNGSGSVITLIDGAQQEHLITPVNNVVDTTSAGDAFNGVYLGARLNQYDASKSVALAASAAGFVIQHKGAIVEQAKFDTFLQSFNSQ